MPLLSFIVLSYNYERYIGDTIRSILAQTIQDFEIVVVDDASEDSSCRIIRSFKDPRIRLLINEQNIGGAGSYNRAVATARGEWLVNLDADDWIAASKSEIQIAFARANPHLDIIGTYVNVVDEHGNAHPRRRQIEELVNSPRKLERLDTWIGMNPLCRSSTIVRRSRHLEIGLDDETMVRAPDYELWTRALREGFRFAVVPERLTFMRLHSRGVTHSDPTGTMLEMSYAMLKNLIPLAERRALNPSIVAIIAWVADHGQFPALKPIEAHRLLGAMILSPPLQDFGAYRWLLGQQTSESELARAGRRCLILMHEVPLRTKIRTTLRNRINLAIFIGLMAIARSGLFLVPLNRSRKRYLEARLADLTGRQIRTSTNQMFRRLFSRTREFILRRRRP